MSYVLLDVTGEVEFVQQEGGYADPSLDIDGHPIALLVEEAMTKKDGMVTAKLYRTVFQTPNYFIGPLGRCRLTITQLEEGES